MMNIDLDTLRPTALAALAAILSQEAEHNDIPEDIGGDVTGYFATAAQEAAEALIAIVGKDTALAMLMEAGAQPEYLDI